MESDRFRRYKKEISRELAKLDVGVALADAPAHMLREMFAERIPPRETARRIARPTMLPGPARERSLRAERVRFRRRK